MDSYESGLLELNLHPGYILYENNLSYDLNTSCTIQAEFCINEFGHITYVNNAMCCLSEYSREELLNITLFDIDTSLRSQNWTEVWKLIKNNGSIKLLSQYQTKANQIKNVSVSICYVKHNLIEFACAFVSHTTSHTSDEQLNNQSDLYLVRLN